MSEKLCKGKSIVCTEAGTVCETCGFNGEEEARRKLLPFVKDERTGLRRKLIRRPRLPEGEADE